MSDSGAFNTANRAIGALSGTPILLVMVILNIAFLTVAAYYLRQQEDNSYKLIDHVVDRCLPGEAHIRPP